MHLSKRTFLGVLGLCLGLFLISFTGVASAQYEAPAQVSDATVERGQEIVFSGSGFAPGAEVAIVLGGEVVGTDQADAQGNFVTTVTIPCDFPAGDTTLQGTGANADGGTRTVTANLTVTGGECPPGAPRQVAPRGEARPQAGVGAVDRGGLPVTGQASTTPLVAAGVGLVLIGGVAVTAARRRRTAQAAGRL